MQNRNARETAATIADTTAVAAVSVARAARKSEQMIAALTLALEGEVIDRLFIATVECQDAREGATGAQLRELTAEYRRLVLELNSVIRSKVECYAVLRGR